MIHSDKLIEAMHEGKLDLHCVEVAIKQNFEGGLDLKGYGILKVNQVGTIYLEFICTTAGKIPVQSFYSTFPEDPFDASQKLYLEAVTLDGDAACRWHQRRSGALGLALLFRKAPRGRA